MYVLIALPNIRYPSTLKIFGQIDDTNEMAIIGGTGEFAMAQGTVKTKYFQTPTPEGVIREFQIRAMVPNLRKPVRNYEQFPFYVYM